MKQKIHILHLIHHLDVGGAEVLLAELLPLFDKNRFQIHAACLTRKGTLYPLLQSQGIPMSFLGKKWGIDLRAILNLASLLRQSEIRILHTHDFSAGFWGRLAALLVRPRPVIISTMHSVSGWHKPIKHRLLGNMLPNPAHVVAVSRSVRDSLIHHDGVPPGLITVIHNGVCLKRLTLPQQMTRPDSFQPCNGAKIIGTVARCSPEKGCRYFIQALSMLRQRGLNIQGVLVGNGPEWCRLKDLASSLGLQDNIHFPGMDFQIGPWLHSFDVMVCPSLEESFGMSALEAQAAGVPVVATQVNGFMEILLHERNALLVPPGDAQALADAIQRILHSPDLASRLAEAGRINAESCYSIDQTAKQHEKLYMDCLNQNTRIPHPVKESEPLPV